MPVFRAIQFSFWYGLTPLRDFLKCFERGFSFDISFFYFFYIFVRFDGKIEQFICYFWLFKIVKKKKNSNILFLFLLCFHYQKKKKIPDFGTDMQTWQYRTWKYETSFL